MEKDIYEKSNNCRYALGIEGKNPLIFLGVNPSTATPDNYDQTMKRARYFALENKFKIADKFDSWIMFNIYPQRATNPNDLDKKRDNVIHEENIKIIKKLLPPHSTVIATWGNSIAKKKILI